MAVSEGTGHFLCAGSFFLAKGYACRMDLARVWKGGEARQIVARPQFDRALAGPGTPACETGCHQKIQTSLIFMTKNGILS